MGQKVHPLGFRVGITKKHQSQWFARFNKYKYSQSLLEDRVIRDTLSKLFPELLNPILNSSGAKKRAHTDSRSEENSQAVTPRITQIKIERGLIPYEIGIQIHAENCDLLKSAIDNLKVKRELIAKLQKTRRYLLNLKLKLKDLNTNTDDSSTISLEQKGTVNKVLEENGNKLNNILVGSAGKKKINKRRLLAKTKITAQVSPKKQNFKKSFERSFRPKLNKQELRRQRLIKKRLNKRQSIRRRYRQLILKGLFIKKAGSFNKIIQTLSLKSKKFEKTRTKKKIQRNSVNLKGNITGQSKQTVITRKSTFSSRIKKKFVTLFIQKMNKRFLSHLKVLLLNYNSNFFSQASTNNVKYLPLGYNKQWDLNRLNTLKNQPIYKLNRMVIVLEQKLLLKLESLRKEFIAFGSISAKSSESLGYFQILNFLKHLKELVNKLKREQKLQLSISKNSINSKFNNNKEVGSSIVLNTNNKLKATQGSNTYLNLAETVLEKKLNNIENECRKVKLIEYVKDIVKKHRTENIYFYLSTMSDVSKELKKIKQFTKRHASFLFGLNLNNFNNVISSEKNLGAGNTSQESLGNDQAKITVQNKITERVNKVLEKSAKKNNFEKTLQDIFLEQIEKQRTMCLENLQLTPKISIKFYSVNKKTLEQKASVVSDSVVDALEKRKAFRKVIKDAKENLMRTPGVKGVKIQVAGRLNGAEIARTEWVRAGRVPLQTLRANLDYSYKTANTIYGIIGVRVWIFKGYAKLITK
jgi:ribosomal protein S3